VTLNPTREFRVPVFFHFRNSPAFLLVSFRESMQITMMACYDVDVTFSAVFIDKRLRYNMGEPGAVAI
jgi:hypothetical protein